MRIYLLDANKSITKYWNKYFEKCQNVTVVNDYFDRFMHKHKNIQAVVSPANSFGLMDGGYDKAIIDYFGKELMDDVQDYIIEVWHGEQPVGTSFSVPIKNTENCILIHTPSMRVPEIIGDPRIIYQCMRTTLIEALRNNVESIVIPAFGALTGHVEADIVAKMMYLGYNQVFNIPDKIDWKYALRISNKLL